MLIFGLGLGMMTTSCEDMLSPDSERHQYEVAQDSLYSYWGILRSLQNIAERYVILNECRADLVGASDHVSDTIAAIMNFGQNGYEDKYEDGSCAYLHVSDFYHVINSCNAYIAMCDTFRMTGMDQKYMIKEYAQVEAIRAWVYMQLVNAYGEVPFYTEPLLTTDDINNFIKDPKHQTVTPNTLADFLADRLIPMEYVEKVYGFPSYEEYGRASTLVCHSTKCMFPVSIVLGDLYLMKGDKESCAKAAQHYYNYLNTRNAGPLICTNFYSTGDEQEGRDEPIYSFRGTPYTETSAVSRGTETISCIPSNKGKLDGKVNTDLNRLFGFTPTLRASGSGDAASSSISLEATSSRELIPSRRYEALCDSVQYEVYLGNSNDDPTGAVKVGDKTVSTIVVLPSVGDARQSWAPMYTFSEASGEDTFYGHFVNKQNPDGNGNGQETHTQRSSATFSTVYPIVYRKSMVWLRFAEALNRAGFPSYAFAILQKGLCNNEFWFPKKPAPYEISNDTIYIAFADAENIMGGDYPIKDTLWVYANTFEILTNEDGIPTDYAISTSATAKSREELEATVREKFDLNDSLDVIDAERIIKLPISYYNYPSDATQAICYFLDRREVEKADATPYLYFNTEFMKTSTLNYPVNWKMDILNRSTYSTPYPLAQENFYVTTGVHSRGGGRLSFDERDSRYNYVDQVIKKAHEEYDVTLTKEDIYSGDYDEVVVKAVEDLIIDEMGMELAFEGTRFSDLSRVALRRNDPTYLAKRVAMRNGYTDPTLYNYLSQSTKNWYLPLPKE